MPKVKKAPLRLCVGCREMKPKKQLLRIVRTPDAQVAVDLTGKQAGRGVYLCLDPECLKLVKKGKRLEKGLKTAVAPSVYTAIEAELAKQIPLPGPAEHPTAPKPRDAEGGVPYDGGGTPGGRVKGKQITD